MFTGGSKGGTPDAHPPPLRSKIFSISCSFLEILRWRPRRVGAPSYRDSWICPCLNTHRSTALGMMMLQFIFKCFWCLHFQMKYHSFMCDFTLINWKKRKNKKLYPGVISSFPMSRAMVPELLFSPYGSNHQM